MFQAKIEPDLPKAEMLMNVNPEYAFPKGRKNSVIPSKAGEYRDEKVSEHHSPDSHLRGNNGISMLFAGYASSGGLVLNA